MDDLRPGELPTDGVEVRVLEPADLEHIIRIDRASMNRRRESYYATKVAEALGAGVLTSLVAVLDDHVVGFVLAKVYYGEFGQAEPVAVVDSIGVDADYRGRHVGQALFRQLKMNLKALNVERVDTLVDFSQLELLGFLARQGFEPAPRYALTLKL